MAREPLAPTPVSAGTGGQPAPMEPGVLTLPTPKRSLRRAARMYMALLVLVLLIAGGLVTAFGLQLQRDITEAFESVPPVLLVLRTYPQVEEILLAAYRYVPEQDAHRLVTVLELRLKELRALMEQIDAWVQSHEETTSLTYQMVQLLYLLRLVEQSAETLIDFAQAGQWDQVPTVVRTLERLELRVKERTNLVLNITSYQQRVALERAYVSLVSLVVIPGALALIAIVLLVVQTWMFDRSVIQPILGFVRSLRAYAQGQWSFRFPEDRNDEIGLLARMFNLMAREVEKSQRTLEQQIQEHTYALQRRMAQIHAAADIGRTITMERDLDRVLKSAVELIAQRFGFYHVAVFLLDDTRTWAVLRASSAEAGERLIRRGFRLRVGEQGIVGYVAQTGQVRVVEDVTQDPMYFHSPEFPDTRSEVALPLRVGEEVLGVLDVQSKQVSAFQPDDVATLRIVADLLAVAIYNARLFQRQQEALETLQRTHQLLTAEAWQRFSEYYLPLGYRYRPSGLEQLRRHVDVKPRTDTPTNGHVLRVPLVLRGQPIALLELRRPEDHTWTPQERTLIQALLRPLALALDNARLFAASQRRLAWLHKVAEMARLWELKPEQELARELVDYIYKNFSWPHVAVYRWDERNARLELIAGYRELRSPLERIPQDQLDLAVHRLFQKRTACLGDCLLDLHPEMQLDEDQSWVLVPLFGGETPWGLLEIGMDRPRAFSPEDAPVLELLAEEMASALQNARLFGIVQDLLARHRQFHQLVVRLIQARTVDQAMSDVVEELESLYPDTAIALYRYDEGAGFLLLHKASKTVRALPKAQPLGDSPYGQALKSHRVILMTSSPQTRSWFWNGYQSQMIVPLRYGEVMLGVLVLQRAAPDAFSPQDEELFTTLGYVLSAIFYNLKLVVDLDRRTQQLHILYSLAETLARHTRVQDLLQDAARHLRQVLDALHCGIALFDASQTWSTLVASASRSPEAPGADMVGTRFPHQGDESIQRLKETREPVVIYNVKESPLLSPTIRELLHQRGTYSLVLFPLTLRDKVIGTVALDLDDPERRLTEDELTLLQQLVNQISVAYERVHLLETLARRAEREHLVREITIRLRATTHPREVIRTALQELSRALGAERAQLLMLADIGTDGEEPGNANEG